MSAPQLAAAALCAGVALAHSWLGERYLLIRLLRRADLPHLFGSDLFTRRTLRFAWHLTSVAWLGFGALLVVAARGAEPGGTDGLRVIAATFAASALVTSGAFARRSRDGEFFLINAEHKGELIGRLLSGLGCSDVWMRSTAGLIPRTTLVSFVPTAEITEWLERFRPAPAGAATLAGGPPSGEPRDERPPVTRDDERLRLQAEFHYVLAGLLADAWTASRIEQTNEIPSEIPMTTNRANGNSTWQELGHTVRDGFIRLLRSGASHRAVHRLAIGVSWNEHLPLG